MNIYLAGGHKTPWRDSVRARLPDARCIDPSATGITDPAAYTAWDLAGVRACDVVFAYFERTNPSGFGLVLEVGYAAGLGKHVVLVDEKSASDPTSARYLQIVRHTADVTFDDLTAGLDYLELLAAIPVIGGAP